MHTCINRSILPSGMGARGVSSEHVENMEVFSGSPTCKLTVVDVDVDVDVDV